MFHATMRSAIEGRADTRAARRPVAHHLQAHAAETVTDSEARG